MKILSVLSILVGSAACAPVQDSSNLHTFDSVTPFNPSCSCNKSQVWNDVVFVLDSSFFTMRWGLKKMHNDILTMLKPFTLANASNVDKNFKNFLQAGVVFYGSEANVGLPLGSSYTDFVNLDFESFYLTNDTGVTNLGVGLNAAYDQLFTNNKRTGPKVVIVMANTYDDVDVTVDPIAAASKLKNRNATIMTYQYPEILITDGIHNEVLYNITSTPAYFFNSTLNTMQDLEKAQCTVNCYCPSFSSAFFPDSDTGAPNQGCFSGSISQMDFFSAEGVCARSNHGILAKVENAFMESFTQGMIKMPADYWIGLSYNSTLGGWVWQDNTKLGSYNNFVNYKVPSGADGDCVMASYAKKWYWITTPCNQKTGMQFVCEIQPCDFTNYCT